MAEGTDMLDERTRIASARTPIDPATVPGWGVDADPRNDPTFPYRDRAGEHGRAPQQASDVEILQSIEHVRRPAVFGTSTPPSGASGMIRRAAFRWSESNWLHWLMLMGADRINVVEGLARDLGRGKIPNILAEMGARAEWSHNKKGFAIKTALVLGAALGVAALVRSRNSGEAGDGEEAQGTDDARLVVRPRRETTD
jgi:hypothetical protein